MIEQGVLATRPEPDEDGPGSDRPADTDGEPVELLVQLAEDGEIDPWDIDIVSVTDAYLERLDAVDLRVSGRALFYASVLLRMKSDALVGEQVPEEPEEAFPMEAPPAGELDPIGDLEREMDRRLDRKTVRGKPETLDELVRELREIERQTWWKPHRDYDTSNSPSGFQRGTQTIDYHASDDFRLDDEPTESEVTSATHGEDVDELIDLVWEALNREFEAGRKEVLFAEIHRIAGSRVETYLGLLFLAHRGRIRLEQDALFGDLWIVSASTVDPSGREPF